MAKTDHELGLKVHKHLKGLGIETPMDMSKAGSLYHIERSVSTMLDCLGLDQTDDSIQDTATRVAKMYKNELMSGLDYKNFPKCTAVDNKMKADEMVLVNGIMIQSLCEHHLMPVVGHASIAYIPKGKVLGLSKFNRIADFFARRPQIQERMTEQIAATLKFILDTDDIAVIIRATHFCVKIRGVEDPCSDTTTSKTMGRFRESGALRNEFMHLVDLQPRV